jgi:GMP synthase (glutamine-hydrolysing)
MKTAAAVRHVAFEDLGSFAPLLEERGYRVRYLDAGVDELDTPDVQDADLLIVLGGPIGAYEDASYPFLLDEISLLELRFAQNRAVLGICLGAQIMARALGARVFAGGRKEIGWSKLELSEAGARSPLRALSGIEVLHWHGDTFDLPDGAELLASTGLYAHQAFSWEKRALALQFHPEVTARGLERWLIGHSAELAAVGIDVATLRGAIGRHTPALAGPARRLLGEWLSTVEAP